MTTVQPKKITVTSWSYFNTENIADHCINISIPANDMQSTVLLQNSQVYSTTGATWT